MKKKLYRCLAFGLAFLITLQTVPTTIWAEESGSETASAITSQENSSTGLEGEGSASVSTESEEDSGTPVPNEPGEDNGTPAPSEPEKESERKPDMADGNNLPETPGENNGPQALVDAEAAAYLLTVDLNGGQVNTMQSAGWTRSDHGVYLWSRSLTESQAVQGSRNCP